MNYRTSISQRKRNMGTDHAAIEEVERVMLHATALAQQIELMYNAQSPKRQDEENSPGEARSKLQRKIETAILDYAGMESAIRKRFGGVADGQEALEAVDAQLGQLQEQVQAMKSPQELPDDIRHGIPVLAPRPANGYAHTKGGKVSRGGGAKITPY